MKLSTSDRRPNNKVFDNYLSFLSTRNRGKIEFTKTFTTKTREKGPKTLCHILKNLITQANLIFLESN